MHDRFFSPRLLLLAWIALPLAGCTNPLVDSITISPTSQSVSVAQTAQFTALGVYGHGNNHPSTTQDITDTVTWTSSVPGVAIIDSVGVATGVSAGHNDDYREHERFYGCCFCDSDAHSDRFIGRRRGCAGNLGGICGSDPGLSIGGRAHGNCPIPRHWDNFYRVDCRLDQSGHVEFKQPADCDHRRRQWVCHGGEPGHGDDYRGYNSGGNSLTGTSTFTVLGGTAEEYTAVTIIPGSQSVSASGQTGQFIALATSGTTGLELDVTDSPQISWLSSIPTVASITSGLTSGNGLAKGVSQGTSTITALLANPDGSLVSNSASVTVTLTPAPEPLLSLTIIPSSITVGNLLDAGQFLAIGTYSTPPSVRDLTNSVTWSTSAPSVFPVNTNGSGAANPGADAGVATAYGNGSATIIAEATDPATGSIQTATATFSCPLVLPTPTSAGSCYPGSEASALLATLTVYNEGLNTTNWLVTAPSATGTPDVLHCGPGSNGAGFGGSVCVATYPVGTTVTLTAPAGAGAFGGWSYNCAATSAATAAGPNTCQVTMTFDDTVGAIFN